MEFQERSSPGTKQRLPRPDIIFDASAKFLLVATTWGRPGVGRRTARTIADYFLSSRNDKDATSPFRRLDYLSSMANNLRIATLVGSEMLYREENKTEYRCGIELFAACRYEEELCYLHIGQPSVILSRNGQGVLPLSVRMSLSGELSSHEHDLPPLPSQLLGVSPEPSITIESIRPQQDDKLILLNRSWIPRTLLELSYDRVDMASISSALSTEDKPYWLGLWSL